jgi:hypothetical protein
MDSLVAPSLARALRSALSDPRDKARVMDLLGWDGSQVSRFLSGQMGITEDKLDAAIAAVGFVAVSPQYLDSLAYLCQVGAGCRCARSGKGECGGNSVRIAA